MFINPNYTPTAQKPQRSIAFGQLQLRVETRNIENSEVNFKSELGKFFTKLPAQEDPKKPDLLKKSFIAIKRWMLLAQRTDKKVSLGVSASNTVAAPTYEDRIEIKPTPRSSLRRAYSQAYTAKASLGRAESIYYPNTLFYSSLNEHLDPTIHLKEITHVLNINLPDARVSKNELEQAGRDYDEIAKDYPQGLNADTPENYKLVKEKGQRLAEKILEGVEYSIEK